MCSLLNLLFKVNYTKSLGKIVSGVFKESTALRRRINTIARTNILVLTLLSIIIKKKSQSFYKNLINNGRN